MSSTPDFNSVLQALNELWKDAPLQGKRDPTLNLNEVERVLVDEPFDVQQWYSQCQSFTFETSFLQIGPEIAQALLWKCRKSLLHLSLDHDTERKHEAVLSRFESVLSMQMSKMDLTAGVFVRLCSRSPKDAGFGTEKMQSLLTSYLDEIRALGALTPNDEFRCFFQAQIQSLCVHSAEEALALLTNSSRVMEDLTVALQFKDKFWKEMVVIRQWAEMDISGEFRGFVYNRQLTAVSQYFDMIYFPELVKNRKTIIKKLHAFFQQVRHLLPFDDCVMDFAILRSGDITCIELNPFTRYTSGCLFDWTADKACLLAASPPVPPVFRVTTTPLEVRRSATPFLDCGEEVFSALDADVVSEHSELLDLVRETLQSDFDRINASLRYSLRKRRK